MPDESGGGSADLEGFVEEHREENETESQEPVYHLYLKNLEFTSDDDGMADLDNLVNEEEAISGMTHKLSFELENISERSFPGGSIKDFTIIENSTSMSSISKKFVGEMREVTELEQEESIEIEYEDMSFYSASVAAIRFGIESKDNGRVYVHEVDEKEESEEKLYYPFTVVDREKLRIIDNVTSLEDAVRSGEE